MLRLYGFDPGRTTGYCYVEVEDRIFKPVVVKEMNPEEVYDWCISMIANEDSEDEICIIVEEYIINPKVYQYDHQGDKGVSLRLIGALEIVARVVTGNPVILSPVVNKPAGYGWLGGTYRRNAKGRHMLDALAHVMHFCVTQNIVDISVPRTAPQNVVRKSSSPRILRTLPGEGWLHKGTPPS